MSGGRGGRAARATLGSVSDALNDLKARLLSEAGQNGAAKAPQRSGANVKEQLKAKPKPRLKASIAERFRADEEAIAKKLEEQRIKAEAAKKNQRPKPHARRPEPVEQLARKTDTASSPTDVMAAEKRRMWEIIRSSVPEIEKRPRKVSADTSETIKRAIGIGSEMAAKALGPDLDNGFIVGFDLGTSSLKCAVGQPYTADDPVRAMEAPPELRSGKHPHLWQTVVWFNPETDRFTLYPTTGAMALGGFKTGLISGQGNTWAAAGIRITKAQAAVAFIALELAYMLGRYQQTWPLGPKAGEYFLSVNIGLPVAAHDNKSLSAEFKRVIAAAFELLPIAPDLSFADVERSYATAKPELPDGFELVPELAAAISAYAVQPTSPVGAHLLVDVGASTLDIVAFNLIEKKRVSVFNTTVDLLGSGVLEVAQAGGVDDAVFKRACDDAFNRVFGGARSARRAPSLFHPAHRRQPVQLLTTGGGCLNSLHAKFIEEMPVPNLLGEVPIMRPVPPRGISAQNCDASRLLLAYGLTRDIPDLLGVRLPSEIDDLELRRADLPSFVSKDCV